MDDDFGMGCQHPRERAGGGPGVWVCTNCGHARIETWVLDDWHRDAEQDAADEAEREKWADLRHAQGG